MVATPRRNNEPRQSRRTSNRQSTTARRPTKARNHNDRGSNPEPNHLSTSPEISEEVGRTKAGESAGQEASAVVSAATPVIETGDCVKGRTTSGEEITGFVSSVGRTCLKLTSGKVLSLNSIEILARLPEELENYCKLVGKTRTEKFDKLFEKYQFYNLSNWSTTPERSQLFNRYNGWEIRFYKGIEVDISKDDETWYTELKRHPDLRGNGDIYDFCKEAIDHAEGIIARIEEYERQALSPEAENLNSTSPDDSQWRFDEGDRIREQSSGRTGTVAEIIQDEPIASDNKQLDIIGNQGESITSGSTLDHLITEINTLYGQIEEAEQVALSAAHSALEFAREMGGKLLEAKKLAGHGNWEKVREQILSPRTGKPIPSSTATLYQRIYERWDELDANAVATIREASEVLKKPRLNPQPVAEMQPVVHQKDLIDSLEGIQDDFQHRKAIAESQVEQKYELVEDITVPKLEELMSLYRAIGFVTPTRDGKGFSVERPDLGNPFPLAFRTRQQAWDYWQRNKGKLLGIAERKPMPDSLSDYNGSSIPGWQQGDRLTTADGKRSAEVLDVHPNGDLRLKWENNQTQVVTQRQVEAFGYQKVVSIDEAVFNGYNSTTGTATFNLTPLPEQPTQAEVDEANWGNSPTHGATYSEAVRAELELVEEFLGDEFGAIKRQAEQAIYKLGPVAVAMMAIEESDYDALLQLREFLNRTIEEVEDDQ